MRAALDCAVRSLPLPLLRTLVGHRTGRLVAKLRSVGPKASWPPYPLIQSHPWTLGLACDLASSPLLSPPSPRDGPYDVVVIGAGAAGLAAAQCLKHEYNLSAVVVEGQSFAGGRVRTGDCGVDLGASYIHGVSPDNALVLFADWLGVETVEAPGGEWESASVTEYFVGGELVPVETVARASLAHLAVLATAASLPAKGKTTRTDAARHIEAAIAYLLPSRLELSTLETQIMRKMLSRALGYVCALDELHEGVVARYAGRDGADAYEFGEVATMSTQTAHADVFIAQLQSESGVARAAKAIRDEVEASKYDSAGSGRRGGARVRPYHTVKPGASDLYMPGGYHDLIIRPLVCGLDVRTAAPVHHVDLSGGAGGGKGCIVSAHGVGDIRARAVICTAPVGVLQDSSRIAFEPAASVAAVFGAEGLGAFGSGAHNKILLIFDEKDVFWPRNQPLFNTPDPRFQFHNLDPFVPGALVAHAWPPYAKGFAGRSDDDVVSDVLSVLEDMFISGGSQVLRPSASHVTRWDSDPFSLGSYSYARASPDSGDGLPISAAVDMLSRAHGPPGNRCLYFAGEAVTAHAPQCVLGAFESGVRAARAVAADIHT